MKLKTQILFVLFIFLVTNVSLISQDKTVKKQKPEVKSKLKVEQQIDKRSIWNAYCPVMGDPVDPEVQTVDYEGKLIGFCCKSCIKKFKKDPEKYLKNLSADGQKFIKQ